MAVDNDATIRFPPGGLTPPPPQLPPQAQHRGKAGLVAGLLVVLAGAGGALWWFQPAEQLITTAPTPSQILPQPAPPPAERAPTLAMPVPQPAAPLNRLTALPPLLDEAGLDAHRDARPRLLRYAGNTAVFVIDFPDLDAQGAAMNRVAALIEKGGLPRDRVLSEAEMADAIARAGDTAATYYYGHNYTGRDLARFFRLTDEAGMALRPEEAWLREQFALARSLVPAEQEIVILSLSAPEARMEAEWRSTVLRHELGHGLFGTRPAYAEHIRRVWHESFAEAERAAFRDFLGREGYDTSDEERMIDETQAYLLHTPHQRFFNGVMVGLDEATVARLRALLRQGAPHLAP